MFKKIISLILIALMLLCAVGSVSATNTIYVDASWRLVTNFQVTDLSTGWTTSKEVAAGNGHTIHIDLYRNYPLLITVTYRGEPHPAFHAVHINRYDGSNIFVDARLKYNARGYYDTWLYVTYQGKVYDHITTSLYI
jgi:hypothetical protein